MKRVGILVTLMALVMPAIVNASGSHTDCSGSVCTTLVCNGIFIQPDLPLNDANGTWGPASFTNIPVACGQLTGYQYRFKKYPWVTLANGDKIHQVALIMPFGSTCEDFGDTDINGDGLCDNSVGAQVDCTGLTGVSDMYTCTRDTYVAAVLCQEGAATIQGCELDTTVGGASPECQEVPNSLSRGGDGSPQVQCMVDLTGYGYPANNGSGLPTVDSDTPPDEVEAEQETSDGTDSTGCDYVTTTDSSLVEVNGLIQKCTTVTRTVSGAGCPNDGESVVQKDCTTNYSDGSATDTSSTKTTDGQGTVTGDISGSTNRMQTKEAELEKAQGEYSGSGNCDVAPTCSGDTLQCAIVAEIHKDRCDFVVSLDTYSPDSGGEVVDINDVDVESAMAGVLGTTGWLGTPACPTIPSVYVNGATLTWSFEGICQAFSLLSYLVVAFAGLTSTRIFMGAF